MCLPCDPLRAPTSLRHGLFARGVSGLGLASAGCGMSSFDQNADTVQWQVCHCASFLRLVRERVGMHYPSAIRCIVWRGSWWIWTWCVAVRSVTLRAHSWGDRAGMSRVRQSSVGRARHSPCVGRSHTARSKRHWQDALCIWQQSSSYKDLAQGAKASPGPS